MAESDDLIHYTYYALGAVGGLNLILAILISSCVFCNSTAKKYAKKKSRRELMDRVKQFTQTQQASTSNTIRQVIGESALREVITNESAANMSPPSSPAVTTNNEWHEIIHGVTAVREVRATNNLPGAVGSNAKQQDEYLQPIPEPRHSIPSRPPLGPEYIYKPEAAKARTPSSPLPPIPIYEDVKEKQKASEYVHMKRPGYEYDEKLPEFKDSELENNSQRKEEFTNNQNTTSFTMPAAINITIRNAISTSEAEKIEVHGADSNEDGGIFITNITSSSKTNEKEDSWISSKDTSTWNYEDDKSKTTIQGESLSVEKSTEKIVPIPKARSIDKIEEKPTKTAKENEYVKIKELKAIATQGLVDQQNTENPTTAEETIEAIVEENKTTNDDVVDITTIDEESVITQEMNYLTSEVEKELKEPILLAPEEFLDITKGEEDFPNDDTVEQHVTEHSDSSESDSDDSQNEHKAFHYVSTSSEDADNEQETSNENQLEETNTNNEEDSDNTDDQERTNIGGSTSDEDSSSVSSSCSGSSCGKRSGSCSSISSISDQVEDVTAV